ncbi:hypothetical protein VB002_07725 [Campylobacter concisus]
MINSSVFALPAVLNVRNIGSLIFAAAQSSKIYALAVRQISLAI